MSDSSFFLVLSDSSVRIGVGEHLTWTVFWWAHGFSGLYASCFLEAHLFTNPVFFFSHVTSVLTLSLVKEVKVSLHSQKKNTSISHLCFFNLFLVFVLVYYLLFLSF